MSDLLDRALQVLPALPSSYGDAEKAIARGFASALIREERFDEFAWSLIARYAYHRAQWDELHEDAVTAPKINHGDHFLSGTEQRMAFHGKQCAAIEKELLGTPYIRAKENVGQATFLDTLDRQSTGDDTVVPLNQFKPLTRRAGSR